MAGRISIEAVSYTHLDVYKRQVQVPLVPRQTDPIDEDLFPLGVASVSYTHLLLLAAAVSFGLQLAVLYHPVLRQVFATVPLTVEEWGLVVLVAGLGLLGQGLVWAFRWTERRPLDIMGNNT